MVPPSPGISRMAVDERRQALLESGRALFSTQPYDELSMAMIAREAGISKALLYHYFPSKQAFFMATMQDAAQSLARRVQPDPTDAPGVQLDTALDAWLGWVGDNKDGYGKLLQAAHGVAEVREVVDEVRDATVALILERLLEGEDPPPAVRAAVCGWLWFMDGVCLDWVRREELDRPAVHALLRGTLLGALGAAGRDDLVAKLR